jgi:hypothetical protein
MKKDKFLLIVGGAMVALIIFLIMYIIILGENMDVTAITFGLSLSSFGFGVTLMGFIINNIQLEG